MELNRPASTTSSCRKLQINTEPPKILDDKVLKVLTELYHGMKNCNYQKLKAMTISTSNAEELSSVKPQNTPRIPRIKSSSPDKKKLVLPERSPVLYTKLNKYYTQKCGEQIRQKESKKKGIVVRELCKLHDKLRGCKTGIDVPVRGMSPRVPSLLIKFQ